MNQSIEKISNNGSLRYRKRKLTQTCDRKWNYGRGRDVAGLARPPTVLEDVGVSITVDLPVRAVDVLVHAVRGEGRQDRSR